MKSKLVILMLALLCVACTEKSSKKSDSKGEKVCLEFWTTYSAPEYSDDPNKTSVIVEKLCGANAAIQNYLNANPDVKNNGELQDILEICDLGHGIVGTVKTAEERQIVSDYLALPGVREAAGIPEEAIFMWSRKPDKHYDNKYLLYAIYDEHADGKAPLDGSVIDYARAQYAQASSSAEVSMGMNSKGVDEWARITSENIGKSIAIVVDGYVYSAPVVNWRIEGGHSSISGDFTMEEAEELANSLIPHK